MILQTIQLFFYLNKLPIEIYEFIRRLTYLKQNKILLEDIEDFNSSLQIAKNLYYNHFKTNYDFEPNADINSLSNDIDFYLNDNQPLIQGYIDKYYKLLLRLKYFEIINNDKKKLMEKYIIFLTIRNVKTHVRFLWGLMKPNERNDMLIFRIKNEKNNFI